MLVLYNWVVFLRYKIQRLADLGTAPGRCVPHPRVSSSRRQSRIKSSIDIKPRNLILLLQIKNSGITLHLFDVSHNNPQFILEHFIVNKMSEEEYEDTRPAWKSSEDREDWWRTPGLNITPACRYYMENKEALQAKHSSATETAVFKMWVPNFSHLESSNWILGIVAVVTFGTSLVCFRAESGKRNPNVV